MPLKKVAKVMKNNGGGAGTKKRCAGKGAGQQLRHANMEHKTHSCPLLPSGGCGEHNCCERFEQLESSLFPSTSPKQFCGFFARTTVEHYQTTEFKQKCPPALHVMCCCQIVENPLSRSHILIKKPCGQGCSVTSAM